MRRRPGTLAAAWLVCLAALIGAPASSAAEPPELGGARSAILVDASDGTPLTQKSPDERRAIASTTKLMTALLTLERAEPGQVFTAPAYNALAVESKINLRQGERMRVDDLLEGLLLESANDAAVTLAEGISGSRAAFVADMNRRAAQLGLRDTSFANPIGLDDPQNYSTARDLARLATRLMRDRRFARIVNMPQATLESGARRRVVANRNDLVGRFPFVDGIKTGHTIDAGYLLVGSAHGPGGSRVVSVVMGEPGEAARDADTLALLRYGLTRFRRVRALSPSRTLARVKVKHRDEPVALVPARGVSLTARRGQRIARRVQAPRELEGPLAKGRRVGTVTVVRGNRQIRQVALVTAREVPATGTLRKVVSTLGVPLTLVLVGGILLAATLALSGRRVRLRLVRREARGGRAR